MVADRMTKGYVEDQFATGVQHELGMDTPPDVTINGWPFLWQLYQRTFDHVEMTADRATLSDQHRSIRVADLDLDLHTVRASDDFATLTAERLAATGRLTWDELSSLVDGGEVAFAGEGRIKITSTVQVYGQDVDVEASGKPVLNAAEQQLEIHEVTLRVVGMDVPQEITDELLRMQVGEINLTLPMNLRVDALSVVEDGIDLEVSGTEVPLQR